MATALFTRWFQFQIFAPDSRLHRTDGVAPAPTQRELVDFIRLRRRLEPYIVSTGAARVFTRRGDGHDWNAAMNLSTFARVAEQAPAFAFGPGLWGQPAPVAAVEDLRVSLPGNGAWFDFWRGASYPAGQAIRTPVSPGLLPLFARAGSILPLAVLDEDGPGAAAGRVVELRVYPGADGRLDFRPDGAAPGVIPMTWNNRDRELRIGAGSGGHHRFEIVVARPGRGIGVERAERPDLTVEHHGEELVLRLPEPPPRPHAPGGLGASIQDGGLRLTWHEVGPDVIYRLKRASRPEGPFEDVASALPASGHRLPPPARGEVSHFVVTATNAGGESEASAVLTVAGEPAPAAEEPVARWDERTERAPTQRFDPGRWARLAGVSVPARSTSGGRTKLAGLGVAAGA